MRHAAAALILALLAVVDAAGAQQKVPLASNRVLVVGTKEAPPFAMKAEDGTWSGISIDLWRRIAERLHLPYQLKETTLDGLINDTAGGSLDTAVAAITVTAEREQVLDFTQPFYSTGLGIAVPKNVVFNWWQLLSSLMSIGFFEALLGLIGVTLAVGAIVWPLERRHTEHFAGGVRTGLMSSVWCRR
jgi:polar amino acid transport system substrate-binding protein